jgi:hypothetical protein
MKLPVNIQKIFLVTAATAVIFLTAGHLAAYPSKAATTTDPLNPDEIILDADCSRYLLFATDAYTNDTPPKPKCNIMCKRSIMYDSPDYQYKNGNYCVYGDPNTQASGTLTSINTPIPPAPEDATMIYIRAAIYALIGATSLLVILYGLYGWYKYAMSEGNPDKVGESRKIFKNAIIGTIIIVMSFSAVQLIFTLLGVTDSVFEFTFIPKAGFKVTVKDSDVGRFCYPEQKDKTGAHTCVDNKWQ